MDFRLIMGDDILAPSFGSVIYDQENIHLETNFTLISQNMNHNGLFVCLGLANNRDKSKPLDEYLDQIDGKSLPIIASQLEGRFVLLFIANDGVYVCADDFGKLDIYYQQNKTNIAFVSNLDLFPENPSKDGFDQNALAHMLTYYGYCPPKKHTIYKSIKRLNIGESAYIKNQEIIFIKDEFTGQKSQEYSDQNHDIYSDIFLNYLKENYSEEGNFIYLSSGWDSTAILAGLVHLFGPEKITGIIGKHLYSDRSGCCNQIEIDKATRFAKYYGIKLNIVDFDLTKKNDKYFEHLKKKMRKHQLYAITAFTHDQLAINASKLSTGNETIFSGEISDGAHNLGFSQYATIFHPSQGFREYSDKMASYLFGPTFLSLLINGQYVDDPIYKMFKSRAGNVIFDDIEDSPEDIKLQLLTSFFLRNARVPLWSIDNELLLTQKGRTCYTQEMQQVYLKDVAKSMDSDSIYASYLYLYNSFHWQGSTVRSLQTMADYYQLNTDLPFWNSNLQDFLAKMPEEWGRGLDLNHTKYPLKRMLKDKIDYPYDYQKGAHGYTYDIDHSFSHAQEIYCYSELVEDFQSSIKDKPYHEILSKDYFDLDFIDNLVDKYIHSPNDISIANLTKLVPIIMLCYVGWYDK